MSKTTDNAQATEVAEAVAAPKARPLSKTAPVLPAAPKAKPCAVVYVGPTLPRGQLQRNAVFRAGELPAHVAALVAKCPAVGVLMVPVTALAVVQQKLRDAGSMEASKAKEITAFFAKGGV